MLYLTVGTDKIEDGLFVPIKDREEGFYKPTGGLWLTKYDMKYQNYNAWVDYLLDNPNVLFYKSSQYNIWHQPCSIVTLKEDANIFILDSGIKYDLLMKKYPLNNTSFSYEKMAKDYDGIYVDLKALFSSCKDKNLGDLFRQYCVSTLLLYNLDCIDYYEPGVVDITPFDLEYEMYEGSSYQIKNDKVRKKIK